MSAIEPLPHRWPLPGPCVRCGCAADGQLSATRKLECFDCHAFVKWVPKAELGLERSNKRSPNRADLSPKERHRIFAQHGHACVGCGQRPPDVTLEVGHLISIDDYDTFGDLVGMTRSELNDELNQAPMCETCNSGLGASTVAVTLMLRCLRIAIAKRQGDL